MKRKISKNNILVDGVIKSKGYINSINNSDDYVLKADGSTMLVNDIMGNYCISLTASTTLTGNLLIIPTTGAYSEGIRISNTTIGTISTIIMGANSATPYAFVPNTWYINKNSANTFAIDCITQSSTWNYGTGLRLTQTGNAYWSDGVIRTANTVDPVHTTYAEGGSTNAPYGTNLASYISKNILVYSFQIGESSTNRTYTFSANTYRSNFLIGQEYNIIITASYSSTLHIYDDYNSNYTSINMDAPDRIIIKCLRPCSTKIITRYL